MPKPTLHDTRTGRFRAARDVKRRMATVAVMPNNTRVLRLVWGRLSESRKFKDGSVVMTGTFTEKEVARIRQALG